MTRDKFIVYCNLILLEYHSVDFCLKYDFADLFTVKSKGWNICVMLAGTRTPQQDIDFL